MATKHISEVTCLTALLRECSPAERELLARLSNTTTNYLYSLAGCHRGQPLAGLALAIEDASRVLHKQTGKRTRIVTVRDLSSMCALMGLAG